MVDLIFASVGAVYSTTNLLFKKSIRQAKSVVLDGEIDISNKPTNLKMFLAIPKNYKITRQFHYEVLAIRVFFIFCMICSAVVLLSAIIILLRIDLKSQSNDLPGFLTKGLYLAVVFSLLFSFACSYLAGSIKPDE